MVQPQVQTPPGGKYSRRIARKVRVAAGWTNDGNAYLIDGRGSSPQKRRAEPDEDRRKTKTDGRKPVTEKPWREKWTSQS